MRFEPAMKTEIASSPLFKPRKCTYMGPQGFGGSGENGYLFSGEWGCTGNYFRDLGSKLVVWGFREPCKKVKLKSHLKEKAFISFDFLYIFGFRKKGQN